LPLSDVRIEEALRQGLHELGYIEGKNLLIEWRRSAERNEEKLRSLSIELANSKVNVIVAVGTLSARAALQATKIPVVFLSGDPVGAGLAESLARPAGNGTGISVVTTNLDSKRLEFLKQLLPRARRMAVLLNPDNPLAGKARLDEAAHALGIELVKFEVRDTRELVAALRAIPKSKADGVFIAGDALFFANKTKVAQAVREAGLPAIFPWGEYHRERVLMSYGANLTEAVRRTASFIDKILKGTKPADIPIEQISKYELIIDLRIARELRLDVPQSLLVLADEVIR
jgi:putative ABC transport system substrate-binding protein